MDIDKDYKELTTLIYQDLAWGPLYIKKDGEVIKNADNNAEKYISDSLKILSLKKSDLKGKKIFNIGTGRESRFFAENGADVNHIDIGEDSVKQIRSWAKEKNLKVNSDHGDILKKNIGENKYDLIFLSGIYQHISTPAHALVKFINALKKNGLMYMGFYRSGEFKYFIVDSIRHLVDYSMMSEIRDINSILFSFGENDHYQSSRVMDDFFVPKKHNFHPNDVIHDIKLLGAEVFYFDEDFRDYNHEGSDYFSIGGDRIYIKKNSDKISNLEDVKNKLKTLKGKNQIFEIKYKEEIINENIHLIKKIRLLYDTGFVSKHSIACLAIGLYQFTRPFIFEESYYFNESKRMGRHKIVNKYLVNFIKKHSKI